MTVVPANLRRRVVRRAGNRCEYCRLSQGGQEAAFHIDHVVPRAAEGRTNFGNLALACVSCSLRKGAKQTAIDRASGEEAPLFNPRIDSWTDHFRWNGEWIVGISTTGRATVATLAMNRPLILAIRREEALRGRHPPDG